MTKSDTHNPVWLTQAMPADERLRIALIDHALGRMTAAMWAELAPELVRGVDTDTKDALEYTEHELDDAKSERDDFEREADDLTTGLKAVFGWLAKNPDARASSARIALADLNPDNNDPDDNDPDDIGRAAERVLKGLKS